MNLKDQSTDLLGPWGLHGVFRHADVSSGILVARDAPTLCDTSYGAYKFPFSVYSDSAVASGSVPRFSRRSPDGFRPCCSPAVVVLDNDGL